MQLVAPQLSELSSISSQWSTEKPAQNSENRRLVYLGFEMEHIHFSPCSRLEFFLTVQTDGLSVLGFLNRCTSNKKNRHILFGNSSVPSESDFPYCGGQALTSRNNIWDQHCFVNLRDSSSQCKWLLIASLQSGCTALASVDFRINLLIEEALSQDIKFSVLFSDSVGTHKLKLFECKLIKLILDFPDVGLLQLGYCLSGRGLLFSGLPQMGLLSWRKIRFNEIRSESTDRCSSSIEPGHSKFISPHCLYWWL